MRIFLLSVPKFGTDTPNARISLDFPDNRPSDGNRKQNPLFFLIVFTIGLLNPHSTHFPPIKTVRANED